MAFCVVGAKMTRKYSMREGLLTPENKPQFVNKLPNYMLFSLFIYFYFQEILFKHLNCVCYGIREWCLSTLESLVKEIAISLNLRNKDGGRSSSITKESLGTKSEW